jgi:hypothetical protein
MKRIILAISWIITAMVFFGCRPNKEMVWYKRVEVEPRYFPVDKSENITNSTGTFRWDIYEEMIILKIKY